MSDSECVETQTSSNDSSNQYLLFTQFISTLNEVDYHRTDDWACKDSSPGMHSVGSLNKEASEVQVTISTILFDGPFVQDFSDTTMLFYEYL